MHIVVGMLLIPPVALKLASTGYRFLRYYGGGSLFAGAALAATTYSLASPWIHRAHEHERDGAYAPVMTVRSPLT